MSIFNDKALKGVAAAVSKIMDEELKGNQHKIDANKNGKVDAHDFKLLRAKKGMKEESEKMAKKDHDGDGKVESGKAEFLGSRIRAAKAAGKLKEETELDEAFPTVDDAKKRMNAGKTATGSVTKTKTGLVHKRDYKDDDTDDADDTQKKSKGYGARQNMGKRGQSDGTKKTMKEEYDSNKSISDDQYHNHETNYPLHHVTGEKDGTMHSHSLKYLHDAHQHHSFARDVEEPSEGGGQNGPAAKAVHDIEKHVSHKYGKEAGRHIANSHEKGNYKKVQTAAKQHMATMKESKLSFTEMLQLYNESGVEVINKIFPQTVKFGDTEVELIDANEVNGVVGITVAEEVDNETFTKEVEAQKEKNAGRGKKAEVAKPSVQAVKQEEYEQELTEEEINQFYSEFDQLSEEQFNEFCSDFGIETQEQLDEISVQLAHKWLRSKKGGMKYRTKENKNVAKYPNKKTMKKHGDSYYRALQRTGLAPQPNYYSKKNTVKKFGKDEDGNVIRYRKKD